MSLAGNPAIEIEPKAKDLSQLLGKGLLQASASPVKRLGQPDILYNLMGIPF